MFLDVAMSRLKILGPERDVRVRFPPPAPAFARIARTRVSARQASDSLRESLRRSLVTVRRPSALLASDFVSDSCPGTKSSGNRRTPMVSKTVRFIDGGARHPWH